MFWNISRISNEKELKQIKFKHFSKLKNFIPKFTWDLVATSSLDPVTILSDNCKFESNLSSEEINSLKALMKNKNIILRKAEKGNTFVITDKENYIESVKRVISDYMIN